MIDCPRIYLIVKVTFLCTRIFAYKNYFYNKEKVNYTW